MRDRYGLGTVALSGGVFQNLLLLHATVSRLEARGFRVLVHSRVPCNDGGISLGQAVVAAARDRAQPGGRPPQTPPLLGGPIPPDPPWGINPPSALGDKSPDLG